MAAQNQEGHSVSRPPFFDGSNYQYWKMRMKIFVESMDIQIWWIIQNGPVTITHEVEGQVQEKPMNLWTEEDRKRYELNSKAINYIFCAVNADEFKKLSRCTTAQEMWQKLQITYEGTSEVRNSRIDKLMNEYETFKMKESEKIEEMFERFGKIINDLDSLGEQLNNTKVVRKVLRSLNPLWKAKVTAIQENGRIDTMTFDELRGNLMSYESTFLSQEIENLKKEKATALKAVSDDDDSSEEADEEGDMSLLTRKMGRLYRRKPYPRGTSYPPRKDKSQKKEGVTCYECKKPGHIKPECPMLKRKFIKGKKKAMVAESSWDDEEDILAEDEDPEEADTANLCLMAKSEVEELFPLFSDEESDNDDEITMDDILEESINLLREYKKLQIAFKKKSQKKRRL